MLCFCDTGKTYNNCCKLLHDGAYADNALSLMRSRYSAYANHLPDYIIRTTHPNNPHYKHNREQWISEILYFSQNTKFLKLEIWEFIDGLDEAYVTFHAHLLQNNLKKDFVEKSHFEKLGKQWLYKNCVHTTKDLKDTKVV